MFASGAADRRRQVKHAQFHFGKIEQLLMALEQQQDGNQPLGQQQQDGNQPNETTSESEEDFAASIGQACNNNNVKLPDRDPRKKEPNTKKEEDEVLDLPMPKFALAMPTSPPNPKSALPMTTSPRKQPGSFGYRYGQRKVAGPTWFNMGK